MMFFHGGRFTKPVMCPIKGVCIPLTGYDIRYFITNLQEPRIPLEWGKNNKSIQTICLCVYRYIIANRVSQKMVLLTLHLHAQQNHIRYYYSLRFSFFFNKKRKSIIIRLLSTSIYYLSWVLSSIFSPIGYAFKNKSHEMETELI